MPSRLGYGLYKKIVALKNIFRCIYKLCLMSQLWDNVASMHDHVFNNSTCSQIAH